ncbi:MAG: ribonuclease HI family protein [Acidobacteriota bacterium]
MKTFAWVDGGSRGNPGPAGFGVLLRDAGGVEVLRLWGYIGVATNNVAEYQGMIAALDEAHRLGATEIEVRTDSELLQRQITGVYRVKQPHLQELMKQVRSKIARFRAFTVLHVRREENSDADHLANIAMDRRESGREPSA